MSWDRKLWGVEFSDGKDRFLIGTAWHNSTWMPRYSAEPTRALLFNTRSEARNWCQAKKAIYAGREDLCSRWKFIPVRVREKVCKYERKET